MPRVRHVTPVWEPCDAEAVMGDYLLKVSATRSLHRWRWAVIPLREVERFGRARFLLAKGPSKADARGHSASLENAQKDAVLMALALAKDDLKKLKGKVVP